MFPDSNIIKVRSRSFLVFTFNIEPGDYNRCLVNGSNKISSKGFNPGLSGLAMSSVLRSNREAICIINREDKITTGINIPFCPSLSIVKGRTACAGKLVNSQILLLKSLGSKVCYLLAAAEQSKLHYHGPWRKPFEICISGSEWR